MHRCARSKVHLAGAIRAEEMNMRLSRQHVRTRTRALSPPPRSFISGSLERTSVTAVVVGHQQACALCTSCVSHYFAFASLQQKCGKLRGSYFAALAVLADLDVSRLSGLLLD